MQSFWEFRNVRIPVKFTIALLLLCVGLIFMSASYYQTIILQEKAKERTDQLNGMLLLVSGIQTNIAEARFQEKSFQAEKNMEQLDSFAETMERVDTDIAALQAYLRTDADKALISEFQTIIDNYQDAFYDGSEASMEVGLAEGKGLAGELRLVMSTTDGLITGLQNMWLQDQFNTLRIKLEEYINSQGQSADVNELKEAMQQIKTQLEGMSGASTLESRQESIANLNESEALLDSLANAFGRGSDNFTQLKEIIAALTPKLEQVNQLAFTYRVENDQLQSNDVREMATFFLISMGLMIIAMAVSLSIIKYAVIDPLSRIQKAVDRVSEGEVDARSELGTKDELGQLSTVLDNLLEEKEKALQIKDEENKRLNSSIITLIQNVFQISQKDLTVRVPVAEDVTGAISDSINQLVESIETVLHDVNSVSKRVNTASVQVKSQSKTVLSYAEREKEEISETLEGLDSAIRAMELISKLAVLSNNASQKAIKTSETAMDSVSQTIDSINKIRQTIHEAEKRIKRLGERSQEIGGIVNLINNISERTTYFL